jgi:hypothetical protein
MRGDDRPHDREPEAISVPIADPVVQPPERLEQIGHALAGICCPLLATISCTSPGRVAVLTRTHPPVTL